MASMPQTPNGTVPPPGSALLTAAQKRAILRTQLASHMQAVSLGGPAVALACAGGVAHLHVFEETAAGLDAARRRCEAAAIGNVTLARAIGGRTRLDEQSMDVALALGSLHTMEGWQSAIHAMHRVLRPGGAFIAEVACLGGDSRWLAMAAGFGRMLRLVPPVKTFTRARLESTFTRAGFDITQCWESPADGGVFLVARKPA